MHTAIILSDEQAAQLEALASLAYSPRDMAIYFELDIDAFQAAAEDDTTNIWYHIRRGQLKSLADEQLKLIEDAKTGDTDSIKLLGEIRRTRGWEISKLDIFGAFESRRSLEKLQEYIQSGSINKLSGEEAIYIEALTLFHSMSRRYGRRNTIAFFVGPPFNLKHARAAEMYDEALALFYTDRNVTKKALRHKAAEQLEEAARMVFQNALSSRDFEVYGDLIMKAARLQELDKPDADVLPPEIYQKPIRVYGLSPEVVSIPGIDRQQVASQIEDLEIPEREKLRLRHESMLDPIPMLTRLTDLQSESEQ